MFNDNYDEYNEEYEEYEERYPNEGFSKEIYFFGGSYKIRVIESLLTETGHSILSCVVEKTNFDVKRNKSLLDVYEYFENSFFLEFLVSILGNYGILELNKCKSLINIDEKSCCIYVTAHLSNNQMYCKIEDEVESDEQTTEIIHIGKTPIMRTHQNFYTTTQAIKYAIVKYNAFDNNYDWNSDGIDWYLVYRNLIEPYIISMMSCALKVNDIDHKNLSKYKNYMEFHVQYAIARQKTSFYCEIYLLPKSVLGHSLIYNMDNGRRIYIGVDNKFDLESNALSINSDIYRLCAGSQNLNLLPLNITNLKSTCDNGKQYIVLNEVPDENDNIMNRFILNINHFTYLSLDSVVYITPVRGFDPCPITLDNNYESILCFLSFLDPDNLVNSFISISDDKFVIGVVSFCTEKELPIDYMIHTVAETKDNSIIPWVFYERLEKVFGSINSKTEFALVPIRALPKYREFMVIGFNKESKEEETQSDIINKKEETDVSVKKKHKFFGLW